MDPINSLEETKAAGQLKDQIKTLTQPALLVMHEISKLPVNQSGAVLFFQIVNRLYERATMAPAMCAIFSGP